MVNVTTIEMPALATIAEVAAYLRVSIPTLGRYLASGKISCIQFDDGRGSTIRIKALDVLDWIDRRTVTGRPTAPPPDSRRSRGRPRKASITIAE